MFMVRSGWVERVRAPLIGSGPGRCNVAWEPWRRGSHTWAERSLISRSARWPAAGIILLGYVAALVADFPGHFSPDGVWQLAQGRVGRYNTWHPPVMAWLLGLAGRVHTGAL